MLPLTKKQTTILLFVLAFALCTIAAGTFAWITIMQNLTNEFTFEPFAVRLIKVSGQDENKRLQGAEFELYDEHDVLIGTFLTDTNGEIVVGALDLGKKYYFKEITAPYGYGFDELDCKTPLFAADLTELVVPNDELTAALSIRKTIGDTYYPALGEKAPVPYTPTPEDLLLPFAFTIKLEDKGFYRYTIYDSSNQPIAGYTYNSPLEGAMSQAGEGQVADGGTLWLRHGEYAVINGLRVGSSYTVRERSYFKYDDPLQAPDDNDYNCTNSQTPHDKVIAYASGWAMEGHNTTGEVRPREVLSDGTVVEGSSAVFKNRPVPDKYAVTISSLVVVDRILAHPEDVDYNKGFQVTVDIGEDPEASFYYEIVHLEKTEQITGGSDPFFDYYERNDPGVPGRLAPQPDRVPKVEDFLEYTLAPIGKGGEPGGKTPSSDRWTLPKIPESYAATMPLHLPDATERWARQDGSYGGLLMSGDPDHNPKSDRSNKIVIDLHHGSAVIVYGIPTGTSYSVEQVNYRDIDGYILDSTHKSTGTILPDLDVMQDPDTADALLRRVRVDIYNAFVYPLTRTLTVEKKWEHGGNPPANWPESTVIEVYDTVTDQIFDSRDYRSSGETVEIGNLPLFQPGTRIPIIYSVHEQLPKDYILSNFEQTADGFVLTNTYAPTTVAPSVYKRVIGTPTKSEDFIFTIVADETTPNAPLPQPDTVTITGQGAARFAPIEFKPTGEDGDTIYSYKIVERPPVNTTDYDYDQTVYTMKVHILEKASQLTVTTTYIRGSDVKEMKLPLPFTNVYKVTAPASLVITKRVVGAPAGTKWKFKFLVEVEGQPNRIVELDNAHSTTAIVNLPQGVHYKVTELNYAGYTPSYYDAEGKLTKLVTEAVITNKWGVEPGLGQLEVTKQVAGAGGDASKEFCFTLQVNGVEHGDSPFYLKHGETRTFGPFNASTPYSVQEFDYSGEGYITKKEGSIGVIVPQGSAAVFTNTRGDVPLGSLSVTKKLLGDAADTTKKFEFTVIIGKKKQIISLAANETYTFVDIPEGTSYSVTEDNYTDEGYVTQWKGSAGTLHQGSNTSVCTNTKGDVPDPLDKGKLTVTKTVTGSFVDMTQKFNFTVTIGSEAYTFPLRHGESKTFTDIPAGTSYSVVEENYSSRGYHTTSSGAAGTIVRDGNKAEFANEYTSKVPPAPDSDAVQVAGVKTWVHGSNPQASHPRLIKVFVMNSGVVVAQKSVSEQENWRYAFNLPKYDAQGNEIRYSISEENVPQYVKTITGYNITNTFTKGAPDTGDSNQMNIWIILLALSTAGLYAAVFYCKEEGTKK